MAVKAQQPEEPEPPGGVSPGQKGTSFTRTKKRICLELFFFLIANSKCLSLSQHSSPFQTKLQLYFSTPLG